MSRIRHLLVTCIISFLSIGVLHSQWIQMGGLSEGKIRCLCVRDTTLFAGTQDSGAYCSTENGTDWTAINTGLTSSFVQSFTVSGPNLFAGTSGGVFLSTDDGANWTAVNSGLPGTNVFAVAADGPTIYAGTADSGIYISPNNGTSWTAANTGLTNKTITCLVVSPNGTGGSNIFAGTYGGGVFLSINNGTSWAEINNGLTSNYVRVLAAGPNGTGGTNLYAGTYNDGVFLSTDNGSSWNEKNTGLLYKSILSLAQIGPNIYAGTDGGGIFFSGNNGTSWTAVNTGLINPYIMALAASDPYLFAGSLGAGIWKRPISETMTSLHESSSDIIENYRLAQNYPNPFNPTTVIGYDLPRTSRVMLKVYDVIGKEVGTLINSVISAGHHEVEFNSNNLASGIYFYKIQAGSFTQIKKMLLLR